MSGAIAGTLVSSTADTWYGYIVLTIADLTKRAFSIAAGGGYALSFAPQRSSL